MPLFVTLILMLIVAYALHREGLFTALLMCLNLLLAGIVTFNFFEPVADWLDGLFRGSALAGFEDAITLGVLFAASLGILRTVTNNLADTILDFSGTMNQIGGAGLGLVAGYLLAGFLFVLCETLPWHENFLDFQPRAQAEDNLRRLLPPDRVWLAMMRHAGAYPLAWKTAEPDAESPYDRFRTFDRRGTFELRYQRYRRHGDHRAPMNYVGELDKALEIKK